MKKIALVLAILLASGSAYADSVPLPPHKHDGHHHKHHHKHHGHHHKHHKHHKKVVAN